ncbi:GNAT family N-acetyltransferase [Fulvivirga sp.]|uniref:GNAT family N-acetyltransferase n=1 Tax=Fulvivirga sp. TaxID=1931237 RepID=UPI0032EB3A4B
MLSFEVPEGYRFDFEEYLFNTERHRLTQAKDGWKSFYWLDEKKKRVKASFHVHVDGSIARSPYRATFGGVDFSSNMSQKHLTVFIQSVEKFLMDINIQTFQIIMSPQHHNNSSFSKHFQALVDNGFGNLKSDLTAVIKINSNSFESRISNSARLNLKKSKNLIFSRHDKEQYTEIYDVIKESRKERGYEISMTKSQLIKLAEQIASKTHFFGVYKNDVLVGGAVCFEVSNRVLYAFYVGHLKSFETLNPTGYLYSQVYKFCQENNFELLDLGTSAENGKTKFSLLEFKQSIGAEPSLKLTFSKKKIR